MYIKKLCAYIWPFFTFFLLNDFVTETGKRKGHIIHNLGTWELHLFGEQQGQKLRELVKIVLRDSSKKCLVFLPFSKFFLYG